MSKTGLVFLHAVTALHPGSGTAMGAVDLPVQRERHTGWPIVPGSSLKGVLRAAYKDAIPGDQWKTIFGPEADNASEHAGAIAITDAKCILFPVRSLSGVFAWVTCPAALARLHTDLTLAGLANGYKFNDQLKVPEGKVFCAGDSPLAVTEDALVLEEFDFKRIGDLPNIATWLAKQAGVHTCGRLASHLAVIPDDAFGHFARHATEILARVGLDYSKKTVKKGALFYEEFLPPETMLYSLVICEASRSKQKMTEEDVWANFRTNLPKTIQIGADETIGKGICAVVGLPEFKESQQ